MVSMTGRTLVWVKDIVVPEAMVTVEAVVAVVAVVAVAVAVAVPVAVVEIVAVAVQAVVEAITDALTRLSEFEKILGAPAGGDGPAPIPAGGHGDPPLLLRAGTGTRPYFCGWAQGSPSYWIIPPSSIHRTYV
jgi:hypothetical protein